MLYGKENSLNLYRFFGDVGGVLKEIMMEESLNIEKTNKGEVYVVWEPESNSLER